MMIVTLIPLNAGQETLGPYRVKRFQYDGDSTDRGPVQGNGYRLYAELEDGLGSIMVTTGGDGGRYVLNVVEAD